MTEAKVVVLDVGHGSSVAIHAGGRNVLVDTGNGSSILEYLVATQATSIERVLISHADSDHTGSLVTLLADPNFDIKSVWLNSNAFKDSALWKDLAYELDEWKQKDGKDLQIGVMKGAKCTVGALVVEVLAPRTRLVTLGPGGIDRDGRRLETNTLSLVVRVSHGDKPVVLLPGDLDVLGLEHLLDQIPEPDLTAQVLVFPHHGGHVSRGAREAVNKTFAERLVQLVQPELVVFSTGRGQHGTPRPEIISAIRRVRPNVRIQCTQLSTRCAVNIPACASARAHIALDTAKGFHKGWCCAGSIVLALRDDDWHASPAQDLHEAFIAANMDAALCTKDV